MENQVTIQKETVLEVYKCATEEQKKVLENIFGKYISLPKEIEKRIKNFKDACDALGEDDELVSEYNSLTRNKVNLPEDVITYHKLRTIIKARNNQPMPILHINGCYYHSKYYIKSYDKEKKEYLVVKGWFLIEKE